MLLNELDFSQIKQIELYPVGRISVALPLFSQMDYVAASDTNIDTIDKTKKTKVISPDVVLMRDGKTTTSVSIDSMEVETKENTTVSGHKSTVTLSFVTRETTTAQLALLRTLRTAHEAVVTVFPGKRYLIRTDADAYNMEQTNDEEGKAVSLTLVNGQGLTLLG